MLISIIATIIYFLLLLFIPPRPALATPPPPPPPPPPFPPSSSIRGDLRPRMSASRPAARSHLPALCPAVMQVLKLTASARSRRRGMSRSRSTAADHSAAREHAPSAVLHVIPLREGVALGTSDLWYNKAGDGATVGSGRIGNLCCLAVLEDVSGAVVVQERSGTCQNDPS
eukprot:8860314-Pyramimonas_sp.AAC.1